jgi:RND family efflux transporter MFP subunit
MLKTRTHAASGVRYYRHANACRSPGRARANLATFIGLLVSAAGFMAGCSNGKSQNVNGDARAEPAVMRVTTVKPQRKTITRQTREPGQIEAFQSTPLYAKIPGFVRRYHVDIGDPVKGPYYDASGKLVERGQLLAELSMPELDQELREKEAAIAQAEAEMAQAQAARKVAQTGVRTAEAQLDKARAAVDRARAEQEKTDSEYRRSVELAKSSSINAKVVDEAKNHLHASRAATRDAVSHVEVAEAAIEHSNALVERAVADAQAANASKMLAEAGQARVMAMAEYQRIEAPFDGRVSARNVDVGHFVQPAEAARARPLFTIVQTDVVRIFVDVPELDATLVDLGDPALIQVDSLAGKKFAGEVTRTTWTLDPVTRTLRTEIDVKNEKGELRPGMYAFATIKLAEVADALAIPLSAVRTENEKTSCFCVADGKLVETALSLGLSDGKEVEVISGLSGDEQLVEKNTPSLADGKPAVGVEAEKPK